MGVLVFLVFTCVYPCVSPLIEISAKILFLSLLQAAKLKEPFGHRGVLTVIT